jgi:hypothetical protein
MLALSADSTNNEVPLPESSRDLEPFLKVLTENVDYTFDLQKCLMLYKLCRKYDITGGCREWVSAYLCRFAASDPFECFALACENEPVDTALATRAIESIRPLSSDVEASRHVIPYYRVTFSSSSYVHADPAYFSSDYIARLGLRAFSCYVTAWGVRNTSNLSNAMSSAAQGELEKLARVFCEGLERWKA